MAVEVFAAVQFKASRWFVLYALRRANRVGHGYQHDAALDLPGRVQTLQQRAQMVGSQHARQLLGMQAGLDVNFRARA